MCTIIIKIYCPYDILYSCFGLITFPYLENKWFCQMVVFGNGCCFWRFFRGRTGGNICSFCCYRNMGILIWYWLIRRIYVCFGGYLRKRLLIWSPISSIFCTFRCTDFIRPWIIFLNDGCKLPGILPFQTEWLTQIQWWEGLSTPIVVMLLLLLKLP